MSEDFIREDVRSLKLVVAPNSYCRSELRKAITQTRVENLDPAVRIVGVCKADKDVVSKTLYVWHFRDRELRKVYPVTKPKR